MANSSPAPPSPAQSTTDLFHSVHHFFSSGPWLLVRNLGVLLVVLLWLGSVVWTWRDARRRIADPVLVVVATLVGAVPLVGTVVYRLVRPPEYLDDVAERRLEIEALDAELAAVAAACPACAEPVRPDFLVCPSCAARLKEPCAACGAPLEPLWQACPLCATSRARPHAVLDAYLLDVAKDAAAPAEDTAAAEKVV